jgi:hypothetical protein
MTLRARGYRVFNFHDDGEGLAGIWACGGARRSGAVWCGAARESEEKKN